MRWRIPWPGGLALSAAASGLSLMAPPPGEAQVPVGAQFQVNTYTTFFQEDPSVAVAPNGDFVVVWRKAVYQDFALVEDGIQAQRYAANGSPVGAEFQVDSYTTSRVRYPSVATDSDGDFIVVWQSSSSPGTDSDDSILGRRYASNGSPQGGDFQVNTYTTYGQLNPSVAAAPDGRFVVVWSSYDASTSTYTYTIQGQRFASNGSTQGPEFQVNSHTLGSYDDGDPLVATASDGSFVVTWTSYS